KVCHDVKTYQVRLAHAGASCDGFIFDTALGAYVLDPTEKSFSLRDVTERYAPQYTADEAPLYDECAFSCLTGSEDGVKALKACATAIAAMYPEMRKAIENTGMADLYFNIELPLCRVLADMQLVGMRVDRSALVELGNMLAKRMDTLLTDIYRFAGEEFNVQSPKQLGEILFERLGLTPLRKTKSGYSTDADVLKKLAAQHEIIPLILEYRQYSKLKSTYCDGLIKVISPEDSRIHSTFNQMVTATGRISSTEPNLQNIPVRSELGGEVRKMFVPRDGYVFVDADYSQIELRVLSHIADDIVMQRAFTADVDIHTVTASQVFNVLENDVTQEMRRAAKAVNFGIVYGISEFSLAEDIGVSRAQAKEYINNYLEHYSGVRTYMTEIVARARRDGFVTTLLGRRRAIPEIHAKNFNLRSFGERVALNAPIQGTAADIMKIAMIKVSKRMADEGLAARLVLQVHDELLVEAPEAEAERVAMILTEEMAGACTLAVPLVAEAAIGKTWFDAKK
ncbi:MAG: DNA polymerase I, partial [Clostridia bacterium]